MVLGNDDDRSRPLVSVSIDGTSDAAHLTGGCGFWERLYQEHLRWTADDAGDGTDSGGADGGSEHFVAGLGSRLHHVTQPLPPTPWAPSPPPLVTRAATLLDASAAARVVTQPPLRVSLTQASIGRPTAGLSVLLSVIGMTGAGAVVAWWSSRDGVARML